MRVTMVRTVVTPSPTLAGAEPLSSQKETQDMQTIMLEGMYTCQQINLSSSQQFWRILLYVTEDTIGKLYVTKILVK